MFRTQGVKKTMKRMFRCRITRPPWCAKDAGETADIYKMSLLAAYKMRKEILCQCYNTEIIHVHYFFIDVKSCVLYQATLTYTCIIDKDFDVTKNLNCSLSR